MIDIKNIEFSDNVRKNNIRDIEITLDVIKGIKITDLERKYNLRKERIKHIHDLYIRIAKRYKNEVSTENFRDNPDKNTSIMILTAYKEFLIISESKRLSRCEHYYGIRESSVLLGSGKRCEQLDFIFNYCPECGFKLDDKNI